MDALLKIKEPDHLKMIAYADDIAVLAGGARKETAIKWLVTIKRWADERGLTFSAAKSQTVCKMWLKTQLCCPFCGIRQHRGE